MEEYKTRFRMDDEDTRDDDGRLIVQADGFDFLKISHIIPHIPHFVMKSDSGGETVCYHLKLYAYALRLCSCY